MEDMVKENEGVEVYTEIENEIKLHIANENGNVDMYVKLGISKEKLTNNLKFLSSKKNERFEVSEIIIDTGIYRNEKIKIKVDDYFGKLNTVKELITGMEKIKKDIRYVLNKDILLKITIEDIEDNFSERYYILKTALRFIDEIDIIIRGFGIPSYSDIGEFLELLIPRTGNSFVTEILTSEEMLKAVGEDIPVESLLRIYLYSCYSLKSLVKSFKKEEESKNKAIISSTTN